MPDVTMPRLSDSMEEGTILRWLKTDGDEVAAGEEIVEIETDKATMTYEADAAGVLHIIAGEGESLAVGRAIATIGEPAPAQPEPEPEPDPRRPPTGGRVEAGAGVANGADAGTTAGADVAGGADAPAADAAPAPAVRDSEPDGERVPGVKASPVARRLARERGIDLGAIEGTGPAGRIVKADVEAAGGQASAPPAAVPAVPAVPAATGTAKGDVQVQELSRTQSLIARRMAESKATIPEFTLNATIDMQAAVELRAQLKAAAGDRVAPSFNDMVVKASALALAEHPRANASYRDGRFELYSRVNVGIAVAAQDALVVPTIFDADRKTLGQLAEESRALAERVRSGAVTPPELSGGTFTVSNLGMYGMRSITPVINPPQAAILGVGRLEERAVVRSGAIVARHQVDVTLSCDHRILYGADAALFLARIRELLEQPLALML